MSFVVVIPARYQSSRLPGKPLVDIAGKPMIQHVVDRAHESEAEAVYVATDDERIQEACQTVIHGLSQNHWRETARNGMRMRETSSYRSPYRGCSMPC